MTPRKLLFIIPVLQALIIVSIFAYMHHKKISLEFIQSGVPTVVNSNIEVRTPMPDLENFYEPFSNKKVIITNADIPGYGSSTYTFNSDSLRETREYSVEKPKDTFRIVTLGDSFTMGAYLNDQEDYPSVLELKLNEQCKAYRHYEVIDLAVRGYDMTYSLERFKLRGTKYSPDLVTWLIMDGDFIVIQNIVDGIYKKNFNKAVSDAKQRGVELTANQYDFYKNYQLAIQEQEQNLTFNDRVLFSISSMKKIRDLYTGPLVFLSPSEMLTLYSNADFPQFKEFFAEPNVHYKNEIGNIEDPTYTVTKANLHPNKLGSELIANDLFKYLTAQGLVPCT